MKMIKRELLMAREIVFKAGSGEGGYAAWPLGPSIHQQIFDAIGQPTMPRDVLVLLKTMCDVSSVHFFRLNTPRPEITGYTSLEQPEQAYQQGQIYLARSLWNGDRDMTRASMKRPDQAIILYQMSAEGAHTSALRDFYHSQRLVERLILCGGSASGPLGFSVMRPAGSDILDSETLERVGQLMAHLFPLVAKHIELAGNGRRLVEALTSLPLIEANLALGPIALPRRESQVAARLLYGLDARCTASDLGIGIETVNTYRKQVHARLGISCHHELLLWYLRHCCRLAESGLLYPPENVTH